MSALPLGFQRTYEELKPKKEKDDNPDFDMVFSVPMRN